MNISKLDKWILKLLFKRYIIQGFNHEDRIIEIYRMIRQSAREEFIEDSNVSLNWFLKECFFKSLDINSKEEK